MMRTYVFVGLVLAGSAAPLGAQSTSSQKPSPPAPKAITLVGCIQLDAAKSDWFTLSDKTTGSTYRLTGANVRSYVWRNVRIVGGLVPSANIAAQAGAIDPTKAAVAYQGANPPGIGNPEPLEFSVRRVRPLTGSCAPKSDR